MQSKDSMLLNPGNGPLGNSLYALDGVVRIPLNVHLNLKLVGILTTSWQLRCANSPLRSG